MELELVFMTCTETLNVGLQVAWDAVFFVYHTIGGQECGFLYTLEINHCDWNCHIIAVFIVLEYLESDNGVLGEDNLSIIQFLEGEHITRLVWVHDSRGSAIGGGELNGAVD